MCRNATLLACWDWIRHARNRDWCDWKLFKSLPFGIPSNRHRAANYTVCYIHVFTTQKPRREAYIHCQESRRSVVIRTHIPRHVFKICSNTYPVIVRVGNQLMEANYKMMEGLHGPCCSWSWCDRTWIGRLKVSQGPLSLPASPILSSPKLPQASMVPVARWHLPTSMKACSCIATTCRLR